MKILVFTNLESMFFLDTITVSDSSNIKKLNEFGKLVKSSLFVCRRDKDWFGSNTISQPESDFILIKDSIDINVFNQLIETFTENETYFVIYHRKPESNDFEIYKRKYNWIGETDGRKANHDPNNSTYQPIANSIKSADTKSDKEIVIDIDKELILCSTYFKKCAESFIEFIEYGYSPNDFEYKTIISNKELEILISYFNENKYNSKDLDCCSKFNELKKLISKKNIRFIC